MPFDPQKHHRRSIRLRDYDYTQGGAYFVTICVARKKPVFGCIENGAMILNDYGKIVDACWRDLPQHFANVILDEYALMPNHFHGILIITEPVGAGSSRPNASHAEHRAGKPRPYKATLGQMMGYFKYQSTRRINTQRAERDLAPAIVWQRNYFERIIRDEKEFDETRRYVFENPTHWNTDSENPNRQI